MKPYCNCKKLTGDKNQIKYEETQTNEDLCCFCGIYVIWAKDKIKLYELLSPKEKDD